MARKKADAKPLLAVKHDFVDALDAHIQECVNLVSALEMALEVGKIPEPTRQIIRERLDSFRKALFTAD